MTTVAFKDGVMASDGFETLNYKETNLILKSNVGKIIKEPNGRVWSYAGPSSLLHYLKKTIPKDRINTRKLSGDSQVLMWEPAQGLLLFTEEGAFALGRETAYAIGSGAEYARGAMSFGATAVEAIKVASNLDMYTGGDITWVKVTQRRRLQKKTPRINDTSS